QFAFHGSVSQTVRSYSQPDLWVMDAVKDAKPKNLTADYDFDMGSSVFGDNASPRGGHARSLYWSGDGRSLFDTVEKHGRTPLVRVDAHQRSPSLLFDGIEQRAAVARPVKRTGMSSARSSIVAEDRATHIEVIVGGQVFRFRIFYGIHDPQIGLRVGTNRLRDRTMERKL